jgi:hypothetical protein
MDVESIKLRVAMFLMRGLVISRSQVQVALQWDDSTNHYVLGPMRATFHGIRIPSRLGVWAAMTLLDSNK